MDVFVHGHIFNGHFFQGVFFSYILPRGEATVTAKKVNRSVCGAAIPATTHASHWTLLPPGRLWTFWSDIIQSNESSCVHVVSEHASERGGVGKELAPKLSSLFLEMDDTEATISGNIPSNINLCSFFCRKHQTAKTMMEAEVQLSKW